jgi:hypothetical protein
MALGPLAVKEHIGLDAKLLLIKKSPYLQFIVFRLSKKGAVPFFRDAPLQKTLWGIRV